MFCGKLRTGEVIYAISLWGLDQDRLDEVIRNILGVDIILVRKHEAMERVNTLKQEINPNNIYRYIYNCVCNCIVHGKWKILILYTN